MTSREKLLILETEFALIFCDETKEQLFDSSKDFVVGEIVKYKKGTEWRLCEVMLKDDAKDFLTIQVPGKDKDVDDLTVDVGNSMQLLKKLGPEDLEEEEAKQKQSLNKTLATTMRANGLKQRQFNPEVTL